MPAETFDAYLDLAWNPQLNDRFGGELSVRTGVYSDFRGFDEDSIRVTGKAMAVMTFSPATKVKFGIWYLNLVHNKLLPAGGVVWSPNPNVRFDILFPNPEVHPAADARSAPRNGGGTFPATMATTPGRSGGARNPADCAGALDQVDYNDIRIALGLDFKRLAGPALSGLFEVGGAFDRQLDYATGEPEFVFAVVHDLPAREPGLLTCTACCRPASCATPGRAPRRSRPSPRCGCRCGAPGAPACATGDADAAHRTWSIQPRPLCDVAGGRLSRRAAAARGRRFPRPDLAAPAVPSVPAVSSADPAPADLPRGTRPGVFQKLLFEGLLAAPRRRPRASGSTPWN